MPGRRSPICFYYRFLADRQAQLAMGETDLALADIKKHLRDFIAAHTWEELCREWTLRAGARGLLDVAVDQVGSSWAKQAQADVVALNSMEKTMVLGECKWQTRPVERAVLRRPRERDESYGRRPLSKITFSARVP